MCDCSILPRLVFQAVQYPANTHHVFNFWRVLPQHPHPSISTPTPLAAGPPRRALTLRFDTTVFLYEETEFFVLVFSCTGWSCFFTPLRSLDRNCICIHTPLLPSLLEAHASWGLAFFFSFRTVLLGGIGKEGRGDEVRFTTASFFNDSLMRFGCWVSRGWKWGGGGIPWYRHRRCVRCGELPCSWYSCRSRGCRCCRDYDDMKIMLLACLPAFLRACVKFVSLCACRKVKKKRP